ncbi:MAG: hypothetical protein HY824_04075 [Acidobacteria bacterium]|nr:hypothetical protein [Acidobacteriota bacterium]
MRHRHSGIAIAALAVAALGAGCSATKSASPGGTSAAGVWTPPRTAWGDPDLQGVWRYEAAIALERPKEFEGRESLTGDEIARKEQEEKEQEANRLAGLEGGAVGRRSIAESPIRGNEYNSFWQDHGRPRRIYKQTSLIVDPRDGRIPFTPEARKAEARSGARYGVGPYESYLDPDTGERCLTDGVTAMMWQGPNGGHNMIAQSPGYVTILHEEYRDRRIIPVDGRAHGQVRQWFGDAVGRWEGDTLVVDTTNFLDRTNYEWASIWTRASETLHLVERFRRSDADTMEYTITVEDPATFSQPWTAVIPISKLPGDTQIYEYACHEGNQAMPNLLSGGRAVAARQRPSSN